MKDNAQVKAFLASQSESARFVMAPRTLIEASSGELNRHVWSASVTSRNAPNISSFNGKITEEFAADIHRARKSETQ